MMKHLASFSYHIPSQLLQASRHQVAVGGLYHGIQVSRDLTVCTKDTLCISAITFLTRRVVHSKADAAQSQVFTRLKVGGELGAYVLHPRSVRKNSGGPISQGV